MNRNWHAYRQTLAKELGDELADEFVGSLYHQSHGCEKNAAQFFYSLGTQWAPLIHAWSTWVGRHARGTIAIILRDAKPLTALQTTAMWKHLYLNRLICGVPDELSGDVHGKQHPLLKRYLKEHGCSEYFTFADSGCYGTVVLELHTLGIKLQPLFFFSKNPFIRGFLNECGVSLAEGEVLNDSLECGFPHAYARPLGLTEASESVKVALNPADTLSVTFGVLAMRGVRDARVPTDVCPRKAAEGLLLLSERARCGEFTGVLGHTSPEWSKKKQFLDSWPEDLRWV